MFDEYIRPMRALIALFGVVSAAIGCDSPLEPPQPSAFVAFSRVIFPDTLQPATASAGGGIVAVDGSIIAADACHGFSPEAVRQGQRLVVTLHARRNSSGCLTGAGEWNYRVSIPNVPPGSWRVSMRHSFAPGTIAETVLDSVIVVPPTA